MGCIEGARCMTYNPENPIIVQSDRAMLVEVNNPLYEQVRDGISRNQ